MVDYSIIQDEKLRKLVMESAVISALAEAKTTEMVGKIARLTPEGVQKFTQALEQQKQEMDAAAQVSTDPEKLKAMTADMVDKKMKVTTIMRNFFSSVRNLRENEARASDDQEAEKLLQLLDTLQ